MLLGCESGTFLQLNLDVSDEAASLGTAEAPALLATDIGGGVRTLRTVCGEPIAPIAFAEDQPFSCAGRDDEATVEVSAWIEPMPANLDAALFCQLVAANGFLNLTPAIVDPEVPVAPGLANATRSASTSATWRRDLSPCGGSLEATLTLE